MNDLDKAREWAGRVYAQEPDTQATCRVIQSLPDQIIDAEKVREIYDRYRASEITLHEAFRAATEVIQSLPDQIVDGHRLRQIIDFQGTGISDDARKDLEALLTPSLRTLSDMTPEEREAQKWMQAKVFPTASTLGIITGVDEYAHSAIILFADGMAKNVPWEDIAPLSDLPRLEWPGSGDVPTVAEQENVAPDQQVNSSESPKSSLPRPEDVPAGEAWLVLSEGRRAIGYRNDPGDRIPWCITYQGCMEFDYCYDSDLALVSRLVPEVKP